MKAVRITRVDRYFGADYEVEFQYDAHLLAHVKSIRPFARSWDKQRKIWTLQDYPTARGFAESVRLDGYHVVGNVLEFNTRQRETPPPPPTKPAPTAQPWAEQLLDAVGPDRRDAVYKAMCRILHPDVATGSTELMRDLNAARDRLAVTR